LNAICKMPVAEFSVVNFDFEEILWATCNGVVKKTSAFCFHEKEQPAPPGEPINFGQHKNCNLDDRCHECLPSERHQELSAHQRGMAMVRFFFLLAPLMPECFQLDQFMILISANAIGNIAV
jgi:hypothetical protein